MALYSFHPSRAHATSAYRLFPCTLARRAVFEMSPPPFRSTRQVECPAALGQLTGIALEVEPSTASSFTGKIDWHLESISIVAEADGGREATRWTFVCSNWFKAG